MLQIINTYRQDQCSTLINQNKVLVIISTLYFLKIGIILRNRNFFLKYSLLLLIINQNLNIKDSNMTLQQDIECIIDYCEVLNLIYVGISLADYV